MVLGHVAVMAVMLGTRVFDSWDSCYDMMGHVIVMLGTRGSDTGELGTRGLAA